MDTFAQSQRQLTTDLIALYMALGGGWNRRPTRRREGSVCRIATAWGLHGGDAVVAKTPDC